MAEEDELYYLQPDFDPRTLKVAQIRQILVTHGIHYPSSATKPQLIENFEQKLQPQAKKLLKAQARVRRTSKGITDVPSSQEGTIDNYGDEDDRELMPPPSTKTPRGRKSKSNLTGEDAVVEIPATTRRSKTPSTRRKITTRPRASDTETDVEKPAASARKVRRSAPAQELPVETPSVKIEEPKVKTSRKSLLDGASPFSDENPFQSGSSPPVPESSRRLSSTSRSRKSLTNGRRSAGHARQSSSTSPVIKREEGSSPTLRSTYRFPVSRVIDHDSDGIDITEEFTPDAAQELDDEAGANGPMIQRNQRSGLTRRRKAQKASPLVKYGPLSILTAILASGAAWYRQEKINIGYCGVGQPSWSLSTNPNIPQWAHENLQPSCEPCPAHAICFSDMEVQCEDDFVLRQEPWSLNGLMPIPPTCEPDSEKARRIKAVADRAVEELRERRAAWECGDNVPSSSTAADAATGKKPNQVKTVVQQGIEKLEIPEEMLKQEVSKMRRKGMSAEEFEDLWRGALGDILGREEIDVVRDGSNNIIGISSSSLARLPLSCAIRRSILRTLISNRVPILLLIAFLSSLTYGRHRIVTYRAATAQIPDLVSQTMDRLATQAALKEGGRVAESYVAVGQLRDDVLRNVVSRRERERVWEGVRKVVEGNSNVRAATREGGKTGEWARVWEWIGTVDFVGAAGLESRRSTGYRRGRSSLGNDASGGGPVHKLEEDVESDNGGIGGSGNGSESAGVREDVQVRKWNEGRAIY